jgi:hypothetical protein
MHCNEDEDETAIVVAPAVCNDGCKFPEPKIWKDGVEKLRVLFQKLFGTPSPIS